MPSVAHDSHGHDGGFAELHGLDGATDDQVGWAADVAASPSTAEPSHVEAGAGDSRDINRDSVSADASGRDLRQRSIFLQVL